jgi:hypothetical protein
MGRRGRTQLEEVVGKWGPLPSWGPPPTEEQQKAGRAAQAMLRLVLDARYYLNDSKPGDQWRQVGEEWIKLLDWMPSSREDFERALAEFYRKIQEALLGRGEPSYLLFLADQIAFFEERKALPPLPRGERAKTVIEECFVKLWTEGENWLKRKEFFNMCCTELKAQNCHPIDYRHFVRILADTGLDMHFPPMRSRRKRRIDNEVRDSKTG